MTEEYLEVLREQLYSIMRKNDWSTARLSKECNVSYHEIQNILYRKTKDIRLSTLVRISQGINKPVSCLIYLEASKKEDKEEILNKLYRNFTKSLDEMRRIANL